MKARKDGPRCNGCGKLLEADASVARVTYGSMKPTDGELNFVPYTVYGTFHRSCFRRGWRDREGELVMEELRYQADQAKLKAKAPAKKKRSQPKQT